MSSAARRSWIFLLVAAATGAPGLRAPAAEPTAPLELRYRAEWRLMHAGDVTLRYRPEGGGHPGKWRGELELKTRGLVEALYDVDNHYSVSFDGGFCAESYEFQVRERGKKREIKVHYQAAPGKASYVEYDLEKAKVVESRQIDVPECVHDELAALARLRTMAVAPESSVELPVSNGKKAALARVEAQRRERVQTPSGVYDTVRYEAFLFKNVLYRRNARLFVWLTDDERRLPVQIRVQMPFYIGTVTLQLARQESM
jgi:hypothetical protein